MIARAARCRCRARRLGSRAARGWRRRRRRGRRAPRPAWPHAVHVSRADELARSPPEDARASVGADAVRRRRRVRPSSGLNQLRPLPQRPAELLVARAQRRAAARVLARAPCGVVGTDAGAGADVRAAPGGSVGGRQFSQPPRTSSRQGSTSRSRHRSTGGSCRGPDSDLADGFFGPALRRSARGPSTPSARTSASSSSVPSHGISECGPRRSRRRAVRPGAEPGPVTNRCAPSVSSRTASRASAARAVERDGGDHGAVAGLRR